jgi:peptidoglycan/LPS O-acetylase OafA/YrhL
MVPWVVLIQTQSAISTHLAATMNWLLGVFMSNGETHPAVLGFIVLSGYCIHRSGMRSYHDGIGAYAIRRFFRIYPVFLIATILGIVAFLISAHLDPEKVAWVTGTHSISPIYVIWKLVALEAVYPNGYFPSIQGNGPLQTVAVEMWLYAVYPVALLFISKFSERAWWCVIGICWVTSVILNVSVPDWQPWSYNGSLVGYLPFWWIGAKFADRSFALQARRLVVVPLLVWFGLTLDLPFGDHGAQILAGIRQVAFALCFACLVSAIDGREKAQSNGLSALGAAGYSIYAFHAPIVYLMVLLGIPWLLILFVVVAIGVLAFHFIEKPFIRAGKRYVTRMVVFP